MARKNDELLKKLLVTSRAEADEFDGSTMH